MGAGDFGAGAGGAGSDPVYKPAPLPAVNAQGVPWYEPKLRQVLLTDASGNPQRVHPIDAIVVARTTSTKGGSASSPDLGQQIKDLFRLSPPSKWPTIAYQQMYAVLEDLIIAGDITLHGVTLTGSATSPVVSPNYTNNRRLPNDGLTYPSSGSTPGSL